MKLKCFNQTNSRSMSMPTGKPSVWINTKSGAINLNVSLCKILELQSGSKIEFAIDEERPTDWYIIKSDSEDAFVVRGKKAGNTLVVQSTCLARKLAESIKVTACNFTCIVSSVATEFEGKKLYAIITKSAVIRPEKRERRLAS